MSSKQLRSITDGILQQAANDMNKQKAETDLCFDKRIRETKETKSKLEEHLSRVSLSMPLQHCRIHIRGYLFGNYQIRSYHKNIENGYLLFLLE